MRLPIFLAVLATLSAPATALAASVAAVSGDNAIMSDLGQPYIHSRHVGVMPYWGPCYRCEREAVTSWRPYPQASSCSGPINGWATGGSTYDPNAQWIYGTTNCRNAPGGASENLVTYYDNTSGGTITGTAWFAMNDIGSITVNGVEEGVYSDNNHTADGAYPSTGGMVSSQISLPPGKDTIEMNITNLGGSSYGIFQLDAVVNGANEVIAPTTPSTWFYVSGTPPVEYERVCEHYQPTSSTCKTAPGPETLDPSVDSWHCGFLVNPEIPVLYPQACSNTYLKNAKARWIFGANDGATGTAQSGYSVMETQFDNTLGTISANLTYYADNYGYVWLNGTQIGNGSAVSENVTVPVGTNTLVFLVQNIPESNPNDINPSIGILALTASTGQVLAQTDGSQWDMIENPPTSPTPSQQSIAGSGVTLENCYGGGC